MKFFTSDLFTNNPDKSPISAFVQKRGKMLMLIWIVASVIAGIAWLVVDCTVGDKTEREYPQYEEALNGIRAQIADEIGYSGELRNILLYADKDEFCRYKVDWQMSTPVTMSPSIEKQYVQVLNRYERYVASDEEAHAAQLTIPSGSRPEIYQVCCKEDWQNATLITLPLKLSIFVMFVAFIALMQFLPEDEEEDDE